MLKEIMKGGNDKDKNKTHRFLMRHGLTDKEAIQYTQLNSDFDLKTLSKAQKHWLDNDFHA
jgi:hypothetical protein